MVTPGVTDLDQRLRELAATDRDRPALVFAGEERVVSYGELNRVTEESRQDLLARLSAAERACVLVDPAAGRDGYLSLIAALRCPVPVALRSRLDRDRSVDDLLAAGLSVLDATGRDDLRLRCPEPIRSSRPLPPSALILPTGGTSGGGKRVIDVRMRTVPAQPRPLRLTSVLGWRSGQVQMMASLPPHASSMAFFIEGLADGNTIVVPDGFQATAFLELIDRHRVEWVQATPFHLRMMRRADSGAARLRSIRALVHMSARCPDELKRYWMDRVGPENVYETYGSTEGIGVTAVSGPEWLDRPGTVGKGFFTRIRIVGPDGQVAPPGGRGLVYTSTGRRAGPVYLSHRERLLRSPDGMVSVGDEGWLDRDGYLYLAPRPLSRITVAGETFNAEDLEDALCGHPAVADAGVCAATRRADQVQVLALAVPSGPAFAEADVRQWLRTRVTSAIVPRRIFQVETLPRDGAGKLSRPALREAARRLAGIEEGAE